MSAPFPDHLLPSSIGMVLYQYVTTLKSVDQFLEFRNRDAQYRAFPHDPSVLCLIPWIKFLESDAIGFHGWHIGLLEESAAAGNVEARCLVGIQSAFHSHNHTPVHESYLEEARDAGISLGRYSLGMYLIYKTSMAGETEFPKYLPGLRVLMSDYHVECHDVWARDHKKFISALHNVGCNHDDLMHLRRSLQHILPNLCTRSFCRRGGQTYARVKSPLVVDYDGVVVCSANCLALKEFEITMKTTWNFTARDSGRSPPSSDED